MNAGDPTELDLAQARARELEDEIAALERESVGRESRAGEWRTLAVWRFERISELDAAIRSLFPGRVWGPTASAVAGVIDVLGDTSLVGMDVPA